MTLGQAVAVGNAHLDAVLAAYPYVQPHVGAPGASGTSNQAAETTRKSMAWNAASAGSATNSGTAQWVGVAGSETWTHFSCWTLATGGTFGVSGTLSGSPLTAGDTANIAAGALTATTPVAS